MPIEQSFKEAVADVLVEWTQGLIDDMVNDLNSQTKSHAHNLAQSIVPKYYKQSNSVGVAIEIADYYDFVDKGVRGVLSGPSSQYSFKHIRPSRQHVNAIAEWITAAGIDFKGRSTGSWKNARQSMAWAISTNIKKRGLKAKPFFDKNINEARVNELVSMLQNRLGVAIDLKLFQ